MNEQRADAQKAFASLLETTQRVGAEFSAAFSKLAEIDFAGLGKTFGEITGGLHKMVIDEAAAFLKTEYFNTLSKFPPEYAGRTLTYKPPYPRASYFKKRKDGETYDTYHAKQKALFEAAAEKLRAEGWRAITREQPDMVGNIVIIEYSCPHREVQP